MTTAAATVSFVLAAAMTVWMVHQWRSRGRKPHHLAWAAGFLLYTAGTGIEAFLDWTPLSLRLYYFVAAFMTAAVLGQGTAYLMFSRRAAHALAIVLCAAGLGAIAACLIVPIGPVTAPRGTIDLTPLPDVLRGATLPFNLYGLALLAGGAIVSIVQYRGGRRTWANVLILIGVLAIGAAGAATKAGAQTILYYAELAGLVMLAAGVYVAG